MPGAGTVLRARAEAAGPAWRAGAAEIGGRKGVPLKSPHGGASRSFFTTQTDTERWTCPTSVFLTGLGELEGPVWGVFPSLSCRPGWCGVGRNRRVGGCLECSPGASPSRGTGCVLSPSPSPLLKL